MKDMAMDYFQKLPKHFPGAILTNMTKLGQ
jgi:hypothetical protein